MTEALDVMKKTLPFLGAVLTGGQSAIVPAVLGAIGSIFGEEITTPEAAIGRIQAATPEERVKLAEIEAGLSKARIDGEAKRAELATEEIKSVLLDVQNARQHNSGTSGILILGYLINLSSYVCVGIVLVGTYMVLTSPAFKGTDPGLAAVAGSLVGAALQWVMSNAQQSNGFFFGSSPGSRSATVDLAKAVSGAFTSAQTPSSGK